MPLILDSAPLFVHLIVLAGIGLVAGILGGLLGIGGGLVIIPALLLVLGDARYGPGSLHVYKLAALATAIVLSIPAARQHFRAGAVVRRFLPPLEAFAVLGVIAGVVAASQLSGERTRVLKQIFGATMLLFVVFQIWLEVRRTRASALGALSCPAPSRWGLIGSVVGFPAGVLSGLLGIGGGVWAVPAQNFLFGVRLNSAVANSTCMIVGVAVTAAIAQSAAIRAMHDPQLQWSEGWRLALLLAPGALLGGGLGGYLTHRLPVGRVRTIFYAVLAVTGVRLLA